MSVYVCKERELARLKALKTKTTKEWMRPKERSEDFEPPQGSPQYK